MLNSRNIFLDLPRIAVTQTLSGDLLVVRWSDGSETVYDAIALGREWLMDNNDSFYKKYKFNFDPHKFNGLYEYCRKLVYPNE